MAMIIPTKTLDDNYKLADFQEDFSTLWRLYSRPKKVEFLHTANQVVVTGESGKKVTYLYEREKGSIIRLRNLTDGVDTTLEWR